ncbi:dolichyl-diphosphooligosaccharide--protein glycosyltransferase subunit 1 [Centruroides vittatus]|uniref:dolichyl-diphosphooligosaccharide--protein glycosyltransferase subunit 1 n=1 Tax=Centruroides vittatus TaxID=120091 RepID=UPI00350FDE4F
MIVCYAKMSLFLVIFIFVIVSLSNCAENAGLVNSKVERSVDITSQLVKVVTKINLENDGKSAVNNFVYCLEENQMKSKLAILLANMQDDGRVNLKVEEVNVPNQRDTQIRNFKIHLKNPLQPGKAVSVEVEHVLTQSLIPYPSHITQSEKQLVLYHGNHYFYSPYPTRIQTTTVTLASTAIESYSKLKPVSHTDNMITYGPYENVAPFSLNKMTVHYENNNPFLTVTNLERSIEVSHWGVISVEEVVDIKHSGSILKGPFSRYEYQRDQSGFSSVRNFKTILPASAVDVYYRDEIGNISTSHLRVMEDSVEVELRPRFPLFGGWKTHYVLGYYVPTYEYLYNSGDQYVLKMRFVDHIFDDSVIDEAKLKVILPEGSRDIQVKLPYPAKRGADQLHYTYLDTVGRPVVVFSKQNLVEQHIQDFEIYYKYQKILMLQEPLLVVIALYLLFLLVIIYVRLDFTITRDPQKESKLRVSGLIECIQNHHEKRADIYSKYDNALNKYKSNKDTASYQAGVKNINAEHKNETQAIADLLQKLKQEGSESIDKIVELQRLDKSLKDQFNQQMVLVEKLILGKMGKQQYVEAESLILKKKEEIAEKIQNVLASL